MCRWLRKWICIAFIRVVLGYQIKITIQPRSRAILFGEDFQLDCSAFAFDENANALSNYYLEYGWLRNNKSAFLNSIRSSLLSNHSLYVRDSVLADLGSYQCVVGFDGSYEFSKIITVVNAYTDAFVGNPASQDVISSSIVTFSCLSGFSAPPAIISWLKNGLLYESGKQEVENVGEEGDGGARRRMSNLTFFSNYDSGGSYLCMATNPMSLKVVFSEPAILNNTITPAIPTLVKPLPEFVLAAEGSSLFLECLMVGWPPPTIYWQVNKTRIYNESRWMSWSNGTLLLKSLNRIQSSGSFVCTGQNSEGVISPRGVTVKIAYLDAMFVEEPFSKMAIFGLPLNITCTPPQSYPEANTTWFKDENKLNFRSDLNVLNLKDATSILRFDKVLYTDAGLYTCHASNSFSLNTLRISRAAELTVEGTPEIVQPPISKDVVWRDILWLECRVRGNPQPVVNWYRNSLLLEVSQKFYLSELNQYLTVFNFNQEDVGRYSCKAINQYGTASSTDAIVSLIVPPEVSTAFKNTTVVQNQSVLLLCKFYSQPNNSTYWFRGETPIKHESGKYLIEEDGLSIREVTSEDSGFFRCCSANRAGTRCQSAYLDVQVGPSITNISSDTTVNSSENLQLFCRVYGNPLPWVTWLYNDQTVLTGIAVEMAGDHSILKIFHCRANQTGRYTCRASNLVGSTSKSLGLLVLEKPRILALESRVDVIAGQNLILNCSLLAGNPTPVVVWLRNNSMLLPTQDLKIAFVGGSSVLLKFVSVRDQGRYTCLAKNEAGEDASSSDVVVTVVPSSPLNVMVASISTTSVNITWHAPLETQSSPINGYVLQFKREYVNTFETASDTVVKYRTWFEVFNLSPGTFYWFRVAARNNAGLGTFSPPLGTSTAFSAPSEPRNLQISQISSSSAKVSWEIPGLQYEAVSSYLVLFRSKYPAGTDYVSIEVPQSAGTLQAFRLLSLSPVTTYECRLRAVSTVGGQRLLSSLTSGYFFTTSMSPPTPSLNSFLAPVRCPVDLKVFLNSSSLVFLSWKVSDDAEGTDPIDGFRLEYESLSLFMSSSVEVASSSLKTTFYLENLRPWREYKIKLTPYNGAGLGSCQSEETIRTLPIPPTSPPLNVQLRIVGSESVLVTWQEVPPLEKSCEITTYFISCRSGSELRNFQDISRSLLIRDLLAGAVYAVEVRAFCDKVGFGPNSEPILIQIPASTTSVKAYLITNTRFQMKSESQSTSVMSTSEPSKTIQILTTTSTMKASKTTNSVSTPPYNSTQNIAISASVGGLMIVFLICLLAFFCWGRCRREYKSKEEKLFHLHPFVEGNYLWKTSSRLVQNVD